MNETLQTIKNRRSIRSFTEQQIEHNDLQTIIEAAKYAPSGGGTQPWHFSIIQKKELIEALSVASIEAAKSHEAEYIRELANRKGFHAFYGAPTLIVVSGVEKKCLVGRRLRSCNAKHFAFGGVPWPWSVLGKFWPFRFRK